MVKAEEIYILGKKVRLLQPEKGFRTSLDSVMLAAACPAKGEDNILDMGCGVGGAAFCVLHRLPQAKVTGVELQQGYIDLAQRNATLNNVTDVRFVCCDIRDFEGNERFNHVICNPPYLEAGQHISSPEEGLAIARGHNEKDMDIKDWIDAGFDNLKSGGSLTVIHRADAVDRIIRALGKRFGAVEIIPLWPYAGKPAKRAIIRAIKDRRTPALIHPGITLHDQNGDYTQQADQILRGDSYI